MKKKTGIIVWEKLQPILFENRDLFIKGDQHNQDLRLEDADRSSDFFFEFKWEEKDAHYLVRFLPSHEAIVKTTYQAMQLEELIGSLKLWFNILRRFTKVKTPFDTFENQFYEEFYNKVKSNDSDADFAAFDDERLNLLYEYLDFVKYTLAPYKESATESGKHQLNEIEKECIDLQNDMQNLPKNQVIEQITKIWAKSKVFSMKLIRELLSEFKKQVFKSIAEGGTEIARDIFNYLP